MCVHQATSHCPVSASLWWREWRVAMHGPACSALGAELALLCLASGEARSEGEASHTAARQHAPPTSSRTYESSARWEKASVSGSVERQVRGAGCGVL